MRVFQIKFGLKFDLAFSTESWTLVAIIDNVLLQLLCAEIKEKAEKGKGQSQDA